SRRKKRLSKRTGANGGVTQRPAQTRREASRVAPRRLKASAKPVSRASRARRTSSSREGSGAGRASRSPVSSNSSRRAAATSPGTRSGPGSPVPPPSDSGKPAAGGPSPAPAGVPATGRAASARDRPPPGKACQPPMKGSSSARRIQYTSIPPSLRRHGTTEAEGRIGGRAGPPAAPPARDKLRNTSSYRLSPGFVLTVPLISAPLLP